MSETSDLRPGGVPTSSKLSRIQNDISSVTPKLADNTIGTGAKKTVTSHKVQEYAETAMNELLGWYGYDKVDSRDTKGLNLHHFSANRMTSSGRRSPSDADSSDVECARSTSPGRRDGSSQGSPPLPDIRMDRP